jgi:hypothetical protein
VQFFGSDSDFVKTDGRVGERDAGLDRPAQSVRLLKYLANQMMGEFTRLGHSSWITSLWSKFSVPSFSQFSVESPKAETETRLVVLTENWELFSAFHTTNERS